MPELKQTSLETQLVLKEKTERKNVYSNKKYLILQCLHTY